MCTGKLYHSKIKDWIRFQNPTYLIELNLNLTIKKGPPLEGPDISEIKIRS